MDGKNTLNNGTVGYPALLPGNDGTHVAYVTERSSTPANQLLKLSCYGSGLTVGVGLLAGVFAYTFSNEAASKLALDALTIGLPWAAGNKIWIEMINCKERLFPDHHR